MKRFHDHRRLDHRHFLVMLDMFSEAAIALSMLLDTPDPRLYRNIDAISRRI